MIMYDVRPGQMYRLSSMKNDQLRTCVAVYRTTLNGYVELHVLWWMHHHDGYDDEGLHDYKYDPWYEWRALKEV